jgi:tripartite-type tricarboxylate transporter receptor subunit TctC
MFRALFACSLLTVACVAHAQTFPTKPIRLLVGFTPGSEVDVIGRMIAHEMTEKWGQRVAQAAR